ncbi:hypothetical protein FHS36_006702 [Streptomyces eurocidicus]|uniref:Uncharacterized protein n=3 Tax=Streptomyces eurocidicus TaxID=66423 RepID=A0A7W8BHW9_STREU|nr:hypothetical protein [Streptomyces eurocidicus]MBB5123222.1 hypothetical protein [Streptomyces eurocidicus]
MGICDEDAAEANRSRARWALIAMEAMGRETGQHGSAYSPEGLMVREEVLREVAGDLMANLFHLCRLNGVAPAAVVAAGAMHFLAEVAEEQPVVELGMPADQETPRGQSRSS